MKQVTEILPNFSNDPLWDKKVKLAGELAEEYKITFTDALQAINFVVLNNFMYPTATNYTQKAHKEIERRKRLGWYKNSSEGVIGA